MVSAADSSYSTSLYTYDADGKRMRRQTGGTEVWQVYGMDGELLSEYAANAAPASPQKEYGYRNGELLVSASNAAPVNLALNKSATQSSTFSNFPASLAVDGNTNGDFNGAHTSSATNYSYQPWWQLDLSSSQFINTIKLYPRTDCCPEMLANAYLLVSDQPFTSTDLSTTLAQAGVSSYIITGNTSGPTIINVNRTGRYIRVQRSETQYLVLAEVQVWGQQTSAVADVEWMVSDHLGTPRMLLDQTGSLSGVKRHDYLPFGEELFPGTGGRTSSQGYTGTGDAVRQKFTGKERDGETGLDYFQARYYGSMMGRFTSVDPLIASGRANTPQSWNRYTYVLNNPLKLVDANGLLDGEAGQQRQKQLPPPIPAIDPTSVPGPPVPTVTVPIVTPSVGNFDVGLPPIMAAGEPVPAQVDTLLVTPLTKENFADGVTGIADFVDYQIKDQYSKVYPDQDDELGPPDLEAQEELTNVALSKGLNPSRGSSQRVNRNGTFKDTVGVFVEGASSMPTGINAVVRQTITIENKATGTKYDVRLNCIRITNEGVKIQDVSRNPQSCVVPPH